MSCSFTLYVHSITSCAIMCVESKLSVWSEHEYNDQICKTNNEFSISHKACVNIPKDYFSILSDCNVLTKINVTFLI